MKIEKPVAWSTFRPAEGPDWVVTVRVPDEEDDIPVTVFGVATEAEAIQEAFWSFGVTPADPKGYKIVRVEKDES